MALENARMGRHPSVGARTPVAPRDVRVHEPDALGREPEDCEASRRCCWLGHGRSHVRARPTLMPVDRRARGLGEIQLSKTSHPAMDSFPGTAIDAVRDRSGARLSNPLRARLSAEGAARHARRSPDPASRLCGEAGASKDPPLLLLCHKRIDVGVTRVT